MPAELFELIYKKQDWCYHSACGPVFESWTKKTRASGVMPRMIYKLRTGRLLFIQVFKVRSQPENQLPIQIVK
jgi:hypothetical protein